MRGKMFATDLEKWPIFQLLDTKFLLNIHMTVVYGVSGNEALIVTKDQRVFGLGSNESGCLGIDNIRNTICPEEIKTLSGKDIKTFAFGTGPHVLALTKDGKVYSWGHNSSLQLGIGYTEKAIPLPILVQCKIKEKCIVDIACGSYHSLVLTTEGEVYAWGQNTSGQAGGWDSIENAPTKLNGALGGKKIVCISCGSSSSMVVTDNGEVYGWGFNETGQLGINERGNKAEPSQVTDLIGVVIEKVVCGSSHTLALTATGVVYAWGANNYGQLGLGNRTHSFTPKIVQVHERKGVLDIAASHYNHISVAMAEGNVIFIWGQCLGRSITVPMPTPVEYMHHAFACYATSSVTYKPVILLNDGNSTSLIDSFKEAFDDSAMSDLVIQVDEKPIYVHKTVLKMRSQHFRRMLSKESETEDDESIIRQHQFSYDVYKAFLKYLYTDEIDLSVENMLELWALAILYSEPELINRCIKITSKQITVQTVATIYSTAVQHDAKDLQELCLAFAVRHTSAIVLTESFSKLDPDIMKAFIIEVARNGAFLN